MCVCVCCQGYSGQAHTYIATQAPLDSTVGDFWTMVWQERTTAVIMLINLNEDGHVSRGYEQSAASLSFLYLYDRGLRRPANHRASSAGQNVTIKIPREKP